MSDEKRSAGPWILLGVSGTLAVMFVAVLITVYAGAYNVAATEKHLAFTRWAFDTTFERSVERRAAGAVPAEKITSAMIAAGARSYMAMCQHCHAGPGVERESWAAGMRPRPPHLAEAAANWELGQIYWIARHGIKMTGMPAFGPTHDERSLWSIAAFVKELPAMTPERYQELGRSAGAEAGTTAHSH